MCALGANDTLPTHSQTGDLLHYFLLTLAAYSIGQVIFVLEMKSEHPDWQLLPCGLLALAWPYVTVRRGIVFWRALQEG
jgi:hypothetical protein